MYLVYIPLLVYLIVVFLVPFFLRRDNGSDESYYLAGRSLGVRSSFLSLVATETSVATVLIFPAAGYNGKWNLLSLCIGYIVGRCMVALHYLPTIYRMTDTSIYKAIGSDGPSRTVLELSYLAAKYISSGVRFFMGGMALFGLFGGTIEFWILITALVAGVYSLSGGLKAVVVTDQLQGMILFLMGLVLLIILWPAGPLIEQGSPGVFTWKLDWFDGAHSIPLFIGGLVLSIGSHGADQDLLQRVISVRDLKGAQRSMILSGFGATIVIMIFVAVGALLRDWNGNLEPNQALLEYVKSSSVLLQSLFAVLVAAASMSTLDSALHSTGAVWKSLLGSKKSGRWFSFLSLLILTGSALAFIYFESHARNLLSLAMGSMNYINGGLIGIFTYFVFWKRSLSIYSMAAAILGGFAVTLLMNLYGIHWTFITVASSTIALMLVILTQRIGDKEPERRSF